MFDFPNTPNPGDIYQPASGPQYQWDGQKWVMSGSPLQFTPAYAQRNRIVNGAFQHSQELGDTGSSTNGAYTADQWLFSLTGVTASSNRYQIVTPNGSKNSLGLNLSLKASLAAGDTAVLLQPIEGLRVADFQWGTALAKQVVLTFWVNAPAGGEGTYSVAIRNAAANRCWVGSYTIAAGETAKFVQRSLVIPGDTTGTWPKDNTKGLDLIFTFVAGTSFVAPAAGWNAGNYFAPPGMSNGASAARSFQIGDVGLYLDAAGSGVPPRWEMPDEADELAACMRYYHRATVAAQGPPGALLTPIYFRPNMRVAPTTTNVVPGSSSGATLGGTIVSDNTGGYFQINSSTGTGFWAGRVEAFVARM